MLTEVEDDKHTEGPRKKSAKALARQARAEALSDAGDKQKASAARKQRKAQDNARKGREGAKGVRG